MIPSESAYQILGFFAVLQASLFTINHRNSWPVWSAIKKRPPSRFNYNLQHIIATIKKRTHDTHHDTTQKSPRGTGVTNIEPSDHGCAWSHWPSSCTAKVAWRQAMLVLRCHRWFHGEQVGELNKLPCTVKPSTSKTTSLDFTSPPFFWYFLFGILWWLLPIDGCWLLEVLRIWAQLGLSVPSNCYQQTQNAQRELVPGWWRGLHGLASKGYVASWFKIC